MTTPMEQKEFVQKFTGKKEFADAFFKKYGSTMSATTVMGRIKSLWDRRKVHAEEIRMHAEKVRLEKEAQLAKDRTVMVPKQIVNKAKPIPENGAVHSLPDIWELTIRQNNLIAELVALQKELISRTNESIGLQRTQLGFFKSLSQKKD